MKIRKMRAIVWVLIAAMITTFYMPLNSYSTAGGSLGTAVAGVAFDITTSITLDASWGLGDFYKTADTSQRFQVSDYNDLGFDIAVTHSNVSGNTNNNHTFNFTGTENTPMTLYYIFQDSADSSRLSVWTFSITAPGGSTTIETDADSDKGVYIPPCDHSYEWQTITAATATADGEEAYMCTKCGDVKERRGLSAMGVFEVEFANKILKAGPGATVYIDCKPWNSFGWAIRDAMKKRPDVTIKASFLSEGYKGTPLKVTIPAARTDLFDNNGYLGLCRARTTLGYDQ